MISSCIACRPSRSIAVRAPRAVAVITGHGRSTAKPAMPCCGNGECRSLQILAGMIGDRPPDSALVEPSWHHIYAVVGWTDLSPVKAEPLHYPATAPERSELARAIFAVVADAAAQAAFAED